MIAATSARETPRQTADLGAGLMLSWLVLGLTMVAAVVAIGGWRRALAVWLASALSLGAVLLRDSIAEDV